MFKPRLVGAQFRKGHIPWNKGLTKETDEENGRKIVVEVFGEIWHDPKRSFTKIPYSRTEEATVKHYEKYGWKSIIIWENELKNPNQVVEKIRRTGS
jgi:G:T-mismatch repair DNA endonuclease (very short patch repair protein)